METVSLRALAGPNGMVAIANTLNARGIGTARGGRCATTIIISTLCCHREPSFPRRAANGSACRPRRCKSAGLDVACESHPSSPDRECGEKQPGSPAPQSRSSYRICSDRYRARWAPHSSRRPATTPTRIYQPLSASSNADQKRHSMRAHPLAMFAK